MYLRWVTLTEKQYKACQDQTRVEAYLLWRRGPHMVVMSWTSTLVLLVVIWIIWIIVSDLNHQPYYGTLLGRTIQGRLKGLGQHGLGLLEVLSRAGTGLEATVQSHLLQDINVVVELKCVVKVEDIFWPGKKMGTGIITKAIRKVSSL